MTAPRPVIPAWSRYRKIRSIGAGGSAQVFLVEGTRPDVVGSSLETPPRDDDEQFVAKRIYVGDGFEEHARAAEMEVRILQVLPPHTNLVALYDHFLDEEGYLTLVMEYCAMGDLEQLLHRAKTTGKPLSPSFVVFLTFQLLCAVRHLHRNLIVHRDLKPGNVFLVSGAPGGKSEADETTSGINSSNVTVKVADFGISKVVREGSYAHTVVGTPFYLAPEVVESQPYQSPADMWAVGCLVYELCASGEKLFSGDNMLAVVRAIAAGHIPSLPSPYAMVERLVRDLVRPNPADRLTAQQCLERYFQAPPLVVSHTGPHEL